MMRRLLLTIAAVLVSCSTWQGVAATTVVFEFGPAIERRLKRLEADELRRETEFRDRWTVAATQSPAIWYAFSSSSERLIPDLREYSLQTLAERMIKHNLTVIGQHKTGNTLIVKVNDFYGPTFNLPVFQGFNALIKGEVTLLDAAGNVLYKDKLRVRTRKFYDQRVTHYEGNGHPYPSYEFMGSFGPMLSVFLHKTMSAMYPGSQVPEPVVLLRDIMKLRHEDNRGKARQRRVVKTVLTEPE